MTFSFLAMCSFSTWKGTHKYRLKRLKQIKLQFYCLYEYEILEMVKNKEVMKIYQPR
jgi:hypothetical protein